MTVSGGFKDIKCPRCGAENYWRDPKEMSLGAIENKNFCRACGVDIDAFSKQKTIGVRGSALTEGPVYKPGISVLLNYIGFIVFVCGIVSAIYFWPWGEMPTGLSGIFKIYALACLFSGVASAAVFWGMSCGLDLLNRIHLRLERGLNVRSQGNGSPNPEGAS